MTMPRQRAGRRRIDSRLDITPQSNASQRDHPDDLTVSFTRPHSGKPHHFDFGKLNLPTDATAVFAAAARHHLAPLAEPTRKGYWETLRKFSLFANEKANIRSCSDLSTGLFDDYRQWLHQQTKSNDEQPLRHVSIARHLVDIRQLIQAVRIVCLANTSSHYSPQSLLPSPPLLAPNKVPTLFRSRPAEDTSVCPTQGPFDIFPELNPPAPHVVLPIQISMILLWGFNICGSGELTSEYRSDNFREWIDCNFALTHSYVVTYIQRSARNAPAIVFPSSLISLNDRGSPVSEYPYYVIRYSTNSIPDVACPALNPTRYNLLRPLHAVLRQLLGDAVDESEEKYGLNWHGKRRARQLALTPSTGTLRPCPEDSVDGCTLGME